jgi:Fe2+ transport system protein FeoA
MTLFGIEVKWAEDWMKIKKLDTALQEETEPTLADVRAGERVRVLGFREQMNPSRSAHLQAYGLTPDNFVTVLQHTPVTIVQVEHLELALEMNLARLILIAR